MCQLGQRTAIRQVMGHIGTIKIGAKGQNIFPTQIEKMLGVPQNVLHAGVFPILPQEAGEEIEPHQAALLCKDAQSALFVGRGMGAAISYEGALKLKEVSYLHAEAYAAGEMKHGPIALIDEGFPVIAVATKSPVYDKLVSNLQESKARGAMVVAIATEGDEEINKIADCIIRVPAVRDVFSPITASVPLQLLAREVAILRGCDVDQPRNLAKSVTVE